MSGTHDAVVLGRTLPTSTNIGLSLGTPIMVMLMSREKQHKEEHWNHGYWNAVFNEIQRWRCGSSPWWWWWGGTKGEVLLIATTTHLYKLSLKIIMKPDDCTHFSPLTKWARRTWLTNPMTGVTCPSPLGTEINHTFAFISQDNDIVVTLISIAMHWSQRILSGLFLLQLAALHIKPPVSMRFGGWTILFLDPSDRSNDCDT